MAQQQLVEEPIEDQVEQAQRHAQDLARPLDKADHRRSEARAASEPHRAGAGVGRLRQRRVELLPLGERRRPVGGRTGKRMPEPDASAELDQPRLHRAAAAAWSWMSSSSAARQIMLCGGWTATARSVGRLAATRW